MLYSSDKYIQLFDIDASGIDNPIATALGHTEVGRYRCKTIKAGNVLECEIFPLWNTTNEVRRARDKATRKTQAALNEKNARKRLCRRLNANFTANDCCVTLTYANEYVPDEAQARRDIQNYIRRIRTYRRKNGLADVKYIYVIEFADEEETPKRVHHHVVMSGMPRDEIEKLWGKGYANSRRLQPNEYGLEALSRYMTKQNKGGKRWCCSRNLKEPLITTADSKISRRKVERMAADMAQEPKTIFEKLYAGYIFTDCVVKYSDYVAGAYIYARLRKGL